MGFFGQEYWSELPFPLPGDLPHPGIEPMFTGAPALHSDSLGKPWSSFRQWEFIVNDAWFTVYKVILSKYNPQNNYNRGFI